MTRRAGGAIVLLALGLASCQPQLKSITASDRPMKGDPSVGQVGSGNPPKLTATATAITPPRSLPLAPTSTLSAPTSNWPAPNTLGSFGAAVTPVPDAAESLPSPTGSVNILLIGSDLRRGSSFRTDTLILVSIQPSAHAIVMLSIPRDLFVYLPGLGMQRINTAYLYGDSFHYPGGGIQLLEDTIRYNLGLAVDHYARIDMRGFQDMIDTLGGVEVPVACPYTDWRLKSPTLDQQNPDNWHEFTVPAGISHMDGETALWYARAREKSSDFDRARRQQEVLRGIARHALSLGLLQHLPDLYSELRSSIASDMDLGQILELAPVAGRIDPSRIRSRFIGRDQVTNWTIPGSGAQVLVPKPEAIHRLLTAAFDFSADLPTTAPVVVVDNASGVPDWTDLAIERLAYAGFRAEPGAKLSSVAATTRVVEYSHSGDRQAASDVIRALGLPFTEPQVETDAASPIAVRVTLGTDYRACFDPTRHQPD